MSVGEETEEFIGRDQEIAYFQQWLRNDEAPSILYIHDALKEKEKKGGIGKTWLLHRFFNQVEMYHPTIIPVFVDFFNVVDRDGVAVAERIVSAVQRKHPDWPFAAFWAAFRAYHRVGSGTKTEANLRLNLLNALTEDFRLIEPQMRASNTSILLFFDTFELVEHNPVTAVLQPSQTFPDFYRSPSMRAVIAGRNELDWTRPNWVGREQEVLVHALSPFNFEESMQYLASRTDAYAIYELEAETQDALYNRSEGRPILLGLISDVLNQRIKTPEELVNTGKLTFEASLVAEINNFATPQRWAIFSMAHIYHRFGAALLQLLMSRPGLREQAPEMQYQDLAETLPALSFVRRSTSSGDFVLHDEMRRLVNEHCWQQQDPDGRIRLELSELAVEYYTGLLEEESLLELRQSYMVEMLFHKLFIDIASGFRYFKECFYEAIELSRMAFARSLFQELKLFATKLPYELSQEMAMAEARLLRGEFDTEGALEIYTRLEQEANWFEQHQVDVLYEKIRCYMRLTRFAEATKCIRDCLEIEKGNRDKTRYANLLKMMGNIHRRRGEYDESMRYYEESLRVQRSLDNPQDYADLLNNMANILRFQNKLETALRHCKLALRIRRDLYQQGLISEYDVGLSYSMLGHIYHELDDVQDEEQAYRDAFNSYNRIGDKNGIAATYSCLGRVYVRKGELDAALDHFRQAGRIAAGVNRETEIESLNQQGRVYMKWKQWEEAARCLEEALTLSRKAGQNFQIAENLLYLVEVLDHLGYPSLEQVKEAKRIARKHDYKVLLGKAGEVQGDICYRRQDYRGAFKYYRVACHYLALRGSPEIDRFLRRLHDRLLEMPGNFLPGALDSLLQYWYDMGLNETYPQLLHVCREVSQHMVL